jgi:hypothetical protein
MLRLLVLLSLTVVTAVPMFTQPAAECPAQVEQALSAVGDACAGLGRNALCYGFTDVQAAFTDAPPDLRFSVPSDRADLKFMASVQTSPFDPASGNWGIALMNVQANIPGTLPGQNVVFILMGDAQIENQVDPAIVPNTAEPISASVTRVATLRTQPTAEANAAGDLAAGARILIDVRSPDGQWIRVVDDDGAAWIEAQAVGGFNPALVPPANLTALSPMQAFRFTAGIGRPACEQAQGALLVQGPEDFVIDLSVNGAHVRVASTVLISLGDGSVRVTSLSGMAQVEGRVIPQGFYTEAPVDDLQQITGEWGAARALSFDAIESRRVYDALPAGVLNYLPDVAGIADLWRDVYGFTPELLTSDLLFYFDDAFGDYWFDYTPDALYETWHTEFEDTVDDGIYENRSEFDYWYGARPPSTQDGDSDDGQEPGYDDPPVGEPPVEDQPNDPKQRPTRPTDPAQQPG